MSARTDPRLPETPLRAWRKTSGPGKTYAWLAEKAGCSERTVMRVAAGRPATPRVAMALAHLTDLPATFFTGVYLAEARAIRVEKAARLAQLVEALEDLNATRAKLLRSVAKEVG